MNILRKIIIIIIIFIIFIIIFFFIIIIINHQINIKPYLIIVISCHFISSNQTPNIIFHHIETSFSSYHTKPWSSNHISCRNTIYRIFGYHIYEPFHVNQLYHINLNHNFHYCYHHCLLLFIIDYF
jgi:hypothetical protein